MTDEDPTPEEQPLPEGALPADGATPSDGEPELDPRKAARRRRRRLLRWAATILVVGIVGFFFAVSLANNWAQVVEEDISFNPLWILTTVLFIVAVPVTGLLWGRIVTVLQSDVHVAARESIAVQCASWILKYVPGQVGSVVNKTVWAGKKGISRTLVVISFIYENVFLQLASLVPGSIILLISLGPEIFGQNITLLLLPVLAIVPFALISWKPFFHRIVDAPARRVLKRPIPAEYFLSTPQTLRSSGEFVLPRAINAVGFVILAATIVPISPAEWLPFAAAYMLAGAIGILAFFVPSGLGVREAVIVLILSQYIEVPQAIIISLLARLLATIADGGVALIYVGLRRTISKEIRP
ncbi:lysylphosphatidylglycerol synthase domain-containing protein [Microbacterium pumilum]|uniref:Lysylphosphatidylglycerol synthase transmembrane domain-containing protein n=1 Tax=Microbacterium pumilum TaxID=344165 RepID=A0ABN2SDV8_9MICO